MQRLALILFVCLGTLACNTPFYSTVNNMAGQPATLALNNGQILHGKISINSFDNYSTVSHVAFAEGVSRLYETYRLNDIRFLFVNGSSYSVRNLKGNEMWGGNALRFVKELTPANSSLQLFENEVLSKRADGTLHREQQLFVQLPGNEFEVYNAQSDKFIPNFDVKVPAFLVACPSLCEKINAKNKDFFYAFVNQGETRRKQVWMNIVNAYNQCQ